MSNWSFMVLLTGIKLTVLNFLWLIPFLRSCIPTCSILMGITGLSKSDVEDCHVGFTLNQIADILLLSKAI